MCINKHKNNKNKNECVQKEKDNLYKAVSYLEARVQVYRNLILENDLVVHDESKEHWKVGFSDSQYSVLFSKAIQTDLTMQILSVGEEEHSSLKSKLTVRPQKILGKNNVHKYRNTLKIEFGFLCKRVLF